MSIVAVESVVRSSECQQQVSAGPTSIKYVRFS